MDWVNSIRSPGLTLFFQYITWLGYRDFLFLFIPFCYWFFDRKIFGIFTLFVFIGALTNTYLKDLFQDTRPDIFRPLKIDISFINCISKPKSDYDSTKTCSCSSTFFYWPCKINQQQYNQIN